MSAAALEQRRDPGAVASALLAAAVHAVLIAALLVGVRWQSRPPDSVAVELWSEPPPALEAPEPPPKAEPVPEPGIEKPEIVLKPEAKPKPKPEPAKPASEPAAQRRMREELAREQQALAMERERQAIREQLAREAAAASAKALAAWTDKVRAKIRGHIVLPQDVKGNPEAIFDVVQLPTGEVLSAKLRKSSGHRGYDEAVERAILKSSPLPKPDRPEIFQRNLELKFRPLDPL
jgi:colicin import membrane protein